MTRTVRSLLALSLALAMAAPASADLASLEASFQRPPDNARIMVRWWWFGPAVTKPGLAREIRAMKAGGIGGFEVQPVYPLALDGQVPGLKNLRFLSPEFLGMLTFAAREAKAEGMRMDLTLGSGWPYGGPMIPLSEAAGRLRVARADAAPGAPSVPLPRLRPGESLIAAFAGPAAGAPASGRMDPYRQLGIRGGAAWLPSGSPGPASVLFFIASHTRMKVKRAAYGAEGYVLDHYSPAAVQRFLKRVAAPEIAACGPDIPTSVFCDSLEVFGSDWTPDLLSDFQRLNGYDLKPYLPALVADIGPKTADIRRDWGRTLTEAFDENFVAPIERWAEAHGTRFRIQAYGIPPAALFSYADANLPEGEGDGWREFHPMRWASSAGHLLGRPVISSETWTWLHAPVFRATPLDLKAAADTYFLQGSNQLVGHGWPYTPAGVPDPGWSFYAAAVLNDHNPWWIVMPQVTSYLQRTSFLLRQGQPDNDVALYLSDNDAWAGFTPGHVELSTADGRLLGPDVIPAVLDSGHDFDFFDDGLLAARGRVEGGTLAFGKLRYRAVVLAGVERMPLATLRRLEDFADRGGILIATRRLPAIDPGFTATAADQQEFRAIVRRLFTSPGAPGIFLPSEDRLGAVLDRRLEPDFRLSPADPEVGFVHRHGADAEIYFVANTGNTPVAGRATFRVAGLEPQVWDLMNGRERGAAVLGRTGTTTTVALKLPAYGSEAIVFAAQRAPVPPAAAPAAGPLPPPLDLSTGWTVRFGPKAPPVAMDRLRSWTDDPATLHFSGVAVYEKTIEVPAALLRPGLRVRLDFGRARPDGAGQPPSGPRFRALLDAPVREAAVVSVDGKRAGSVWCPPYELDLTGLLHPGENRLRIDVANLALNALSARPLPDYSALDARYGARFQLQFADRIRPVASGLLGPLKLVAAPGP
jgi:alpha-L-rhamnosidase